jgi:hypothetical protein
MVRSSQIANALCILAAVVVGTSSLPVRADPWLQPGNASLRHDIELLADAEIIKSPITTWPMSWPNIARDVMRKDIEANPDPQVEAALARVRQAARKAAAMGLSDRAYLLSANREPTPLRGFGDQPREEGELSVSTSWMHGRWALRVNGTAVTDPDDDQAFRLDGSYLGVGIGNFMVSAGSMERWFGPGWDGSLILSTNARPIPSIAIERNLSDAFRWRLLRWLGPWHASVSMGQLENGSVAVSDARFFAARINFRPRPWLEFGLSRTAQWCGEDRPCSFRTFGDLLVGQDNRSENGLTAEEEPGNQMAGYDFRLRSPWRQLPVVLHAQFIGEDEAGGLPSRLLGLLGAQVWGGTRWGSHRLHVEYADTSCNFSRARPLFNCGYRNSLYPQGYTYRGRAIGHALDGDGRMYSIGLQLTRPQGDSWSLLGRKADLNRDDVMGDPAHPVSVTRNALRNLELQYNRHFPRGELGIGLGLDDYAAPVRTRSDVRGFVQWRQGF